MAMLLCLLEVPGHACDGRRRSASGDRHTSRRFGRRLAGGARNKTPSPRLALSHGPREFASRSTVAAVASALLAMSVSSGGRGSARGRTGTAGKT
ncbi:unnamed protein product [Lampetra planeri]